MQNITSSVSSTLQKAYDTFVQASQNFTDISQASEFPEIMQQFFGDTKLLASLANSFFNKKAGEKIAKYYDLFVSRKKITVANFNSLRFSLHLAVNLLEDSLPPNKIVVSPEIIINLLSSVEFSADKCVQGVNSDLDIITATLQAVREEGLDRSRTLAAKNLVDNLAGRFMYEMQQEGKLPYYRGEEKHIKNALTDNVSDIFKVPKSKDRLVSGPQIVSDEVHAKFKFLCKLLIPKYIIIDEMTQTFDSILKDIFPHHYKDARSTINIPLEDLTQDFIEKIEVKLLAPFKHLKQGNTDETINLNDFIEINSDGTCSIANCYEKIQVLLTKAIDDTIQPKVLEVIKDKEGKTLYICTMDDAFFWVCGQSGASKESLQKGDNCAFDNENHISLQLSHLTSLNFDELSKKNYVYALLMQALNQTDKAEDIKAFFLDGNGMDVLNKCPLAIKLKLSELLKNKTDENPVFKNELCKFFNEYLVKSNVNIAVTEPVTLFEIYLYEKYKNNNGNIAYITRNLNASQIRNFSKMSIVKLFNKNDYRRLFYQVFYSNNKKVMEIILSTDVCDELINQRDEEGHLPLKRAVKFDAYAVIKPLLDKGVDANAQDENKTTTLMLAAKNGRLECIKVLLEGSDVNAENVNKMTALMLAAQCGHVGCVDALLQARALIDSKSNKGNTALMLAAKNGHVDCVNKLLASGASVNSKDREDNTALMLAANNGHLECVKVLLEGSDVNAENGNKMTALMFAAQCGHVGCVDALLKAEVLINSKSIKGNTALMLAAKNGRLECIKVLLEGSDVNAENVNKITALMFAALCGHVGCVDALLKAEALINSKSIKGNTALMLAANNGHLECVKVLLKGSDVNAENENKMTALMFATLCGHVDCVNALLQAEALIDSKSKEGDTALIFAASNGHIDCVNKLLASGASVNSAESNGNTALMFAAKNGHVDCVNKLLASGASANSKDMEGNTALMITANKGHLECVKVLLKESDVNAENVNKMTALMFAALFGHVGCVDALLKAEALINSKSIKGNTALMLAANNGHLECVKVLLKAEALINSKNIKGNTALMLAANNGHLECVKVLLKGSDVNAENENKMTALIFAVAKGHLECVNVLLKGRASANSKNEEDSTD